MSRLFILLAALMLCSGCEPKESESTDEESKADVGQGSGTGLVGGSILAPGDAMDAVAGGGQIGGGQQPPANNPQGNAPQQPQEPVIQPRRPADLVDKAAAMAANPNLREVENHVNASDPFSAAAGAYFSAASRIHVLNLKHQVDLMKNLDENNEYPTFEAFKELLTQSNVELNGLKAGQVYAYDQATGSICILEDQSVAN